MGLRKRVISIFLAAVMAVAGASAEGLALEAEAAPDTGENAYTGIMLTKEEFEKFSYTEAEADWSEYVPEENENGLVNYEARYTVDGKSLDEVLGMLKARDKFYWQEDEEGWHPVSGADSAKTDEGYYAVFTNGQGLKAQTAANLDGVNGVLFDTHYYNELEEGEEPDEHTQWYPYIYKDLTVEAKTALTFRGCYSNITIKYGTYSKDGKGNQYPIVMRAEVLGSVRGSADAGTESNIYLKNPRLYGIGGFDKTLFLPSVWRDEESKEEGVGRWLDLNSPTGKEKISFQKICAAELNENGEPQEIKGEEGTSGVDLNIFYHDGYIPTIAGSAHLGIWHERNEETGEMETGDYSIGLNYFADENGTPYKFAPGDKVVDYGNAQGWSSPVWYNAPESGGVYEEYRIDAQGCLYRESDRMFRASRYRDKAEYDAYCENGQWADEYVGESAEVFGILQALAYDSELHPDNAYYTLALIQDWDHKAEGARAWETDCGNLSVPENVKGLRLTAEGWDVKKGFQKITGILDEITIPQGSELELTGWYRAKNKDINISGKGTVSFADARINGNVRAAGGSVSSRGETAVKSLTGMQTLDLAGGLTVEKELGFAKDGQMNVTHERQDAHILARSGAGIEIPNLNCVYDTQHQYGNLLEIFEEVKGGTYPVVAFSGARELGDQYWETYAMNYQIDAEEADENGWKREHTALCPKYRYVPVDKDGNENWEEAEFDLIILNNKVYRIEWDHESENGTDKITLDGTPCTLLHQRLAETSYTATQVEKSTYNNEVQLIPYDASAVSLAAQDRDDIALYKDPYTDDSYGIDVWDEWNCEYHEDGTAEYSLTGITDLTRIAVGYGSWGGEGIERHYEGRSLWLYPIQEYVLEKDEDDNTFTDKDVYTEENGVRKYALFYLGEPSVKSSHYVVSAAQTKPVAGLTVKGLSSRYYYTGKKIKPAVTVYDGGKKLTSDDYSVSYSENVNIGKAKITITGKGNYTGNLTKDFTITVKKNADYTVGGYKYKIVNAAVNGKGTVSVTGMQKKTAAKIKIADTAAIGGVKFKVISIGGNAFKGCKKAADASIGKYVTSVGGYTF